MPHSLKRPIQNHPGILVVGLLIIALLAWGFWPSPIVIESVKVSRAPLTTSIEKDGKTRIIDRYVIAAPVNGMTCQMQLKVGDVVTQGQTLLSISPLLPQELDARSHAQAEANIQVAKSALKVAKEQVRSSNAAAQQAENEVKRYQPLLKKGLISQDVYDKAKTTSITALANQRRARFQVEVAQHELKAALTTLEYAHNTSENSSKPHVLIKSPIDGNILKVVRQCDSPVSIGEALLEIGNPSALELEVDVLSADAVKIKPGMKVILERWGGEHPLEAVVRRIEPIGFTKVSALGVEEQRVWVISDFTSPIEQWQRLGDAYRVEAKFILWHNEEVLQVPASALFRYQGGWAVFTVENNKAKRQKVTLGHQNGLSAQVLTGLKEGQTIINHPSDLIDDGVSVTIP